MVEARRVHPYIASRLHQLVGIIEAAIRCQRNIASGREHDLHLYAPFCCILQCLLQLVAQGEVGTDDFDAILCVVDGVDIEITDDILRDMWLSVDDTHRLVISCGGGIWFEILYQILLFFLAIVFFTINMLSAYFVPHLEEYFLQGIHLASVDAAVHIVPFAYHLRTFYIIVGYVHAACIGNLTVDDYDFPVVTVENGMHPRKLQGFVFINLDTVGTDFLEMSFSQRFVVG